ncbi:MAG: histidine phosphatase family protein [Deinococcota bacterium]
MQLILIRHAETQQDSNISSHNWRLTANGYDACVQLARELRKDNLTHIVTSDEFKATETGRILAEQLGIPVRQADNLHEHARKGFPYVAPDVFLDTLRRFFEMPDVLVFGQETATQAAIRFEKGVQQVLETHPQDKLALVSHGTVMSLFVAKHNPIDVFKYWQGLPMPHVVRLSVPGFKLIEPPSSNDA